MLPHIASVRQAVRFAVSDFKGKELPGFSIPKKVSNSWRNLQVHLLVCAFICEVVCMDFENINCLGGGGDVKL